MTLLSISKLACTRGDRPLFDNLSFDLDAGQILHVTGHNGSGKTTLLRTLCGLTQATAGQISWRGIPVEDQRDDYFAELHFVGHANGIHGDLTAIEQLDFSINLAGGVGGFTAQQALTDMGLWSHRHLPTKILSQGQKRRLALSRLLVSGKRLWMLDEPFTALDHDSVDQINQLIASHVDNGGMLILTSHQKVDLADVRQLRLGKHHG